MSENPEAKRRRIDDLNDNEIEICPVPTPCAILDIPDDVLWDILHRLLGTSNPLRAIMTLRCVCKRFQQLIHANRTELDLRDYMFKTKTRNRILTQLSCQFHGLQRLALSGHLDDSMLLQITSSCCHLTDLRLRGCGTITDNGLQCVADRLPFLERLDLSYLIRLRSLRHVARIPLLKHLDISGMLRSFYALFSYFH